VKTYAHLVQKLFFSPLLVLPSTYATLEKALLDRLGLPSPEEVTDPYARVIKTRSVRLGDKEIEETETEKPKAETPGERRARRVKAITERYGSVGVIHVDGVIDKRISDFELDCYGGCDLDDVSAAVSDMGSDAKIRTVIFDFNTPGGSSAGVEDTAAKIRWLGEYKSRGGAGKTTVARVEMLCASAGMWLASPCNVISAALGSQLGSVGVYLALLDQTGWLEQRGLKVNLIRAGKYKAASSPMKSLSDDERALFQKSVDDLWAEFKGAVRQGRGDIDEAHLQGQLFDAKEALKVGFCDELVAGSLDEFVQEWM
jgi:ClpP class serine protease